MVIIILITIKVNWEWCGKWLCSNKVQVAKAGFMERVMGIEPTLSAWEVEVLPLNYTRKLLAYRILESYAVKLLAFDQIRIFMA